MQSGGQRRHDFKLQWGETKASAGSPGSLTGALYLAVMMRESKLTEFQQRHIMDTMKSKSRSTEASWAEGFCATFLMLLHIKEQRTSF